MTSHCFRVNGAEHWVNFTRAGTPWGCTKTVLPCTIVKVSQCQMSPRVSCTVGKHAPAVVGPLCVCALACWSPF